MNLVKAMGVGVLYKPDSSQHVHAGEDRMWLLTGITTHKTLDVRWCWVYHPRREILIPSRDVDVTPAQEFIGACAQVYRELTRIQGGEDH